MGIHTIVYKLSDVDIKPISEENCASEKFHKKLRNQFKNKSKNKKTDNGEKNNKVLFNKRRKRWLPEEVNIILFGLV